MQLEKTKIELPYTVSRQGINSPVDIPWLSEKLDPNQNLPVIAVCFDVESLSEVQKKLYSQSQHNLNHSTVSAYANNMAAR